MDFELTEQCLELSERLATFMDERVYPAEAVYAQQLETASAPHHQPVVMEELKEEARQRGLWNLFHPDPEWGPGLSNLEYAPLAEIMGRSPIASEACNCSAPDTGNIEVLTLFGTTEQKERWLRPLLEGAIRSAFAMTEPDVASSDATNIRTSIERRDGEYVINGRKWWITNALHPNCRVFVLMGQTQADGPPHRRQSMVLVPASTPGVNLKRDLSVFGYQDPEGHAEVAFEDVHIPVENVVGGEGEGFAISQARLGPGRIHHCMRSIGAAERALEMACRAASGRVAFGAPLSEPGQRPGLDR